jgi:folate-binding protein YgfZ
VARLRVLGPEAGKVLAKIEPEVADLADGQTVAHGASTILCQHSYDLPGYEVIAPRAELALLHDALLQAGAMPLTDPAVYLARRIELGRPAVGAELVEEYNPLEAGLAWACADSKGCYTGQEIIARQITYDKVTRTLVGLRSAAPLAVGAEVMVEGRSMGVVTSAAYSPAVEAPVALAIVKRPVNAPGATVTVDGVAASVIGLPFVVEAEA